MLGQRREQGVVEDGVLPLDLLVHQLTDPRQRLVRLQAVGAGLFAGEVDLLLQAGDADLEELVEVAGEDQQELQTFEQRIGLIQRLLQHPDIELQLRQFTVDVQAAVIQAGNRSRRRSFHHWRLGDHLGLRRVVVEHFAVESFAVHR